MARPSSPQAYLDGLAPERRERLEVIRRVIAEVAPDATEDLIYSMPGFRLGRKHLAAYAAAKRHDGFYPCSSQVIGQLPEVAERFKTSSGAVQLPLDAPIPEDIIELLVRTRIAEIDAGA